MAQNTNLTVTSGGTVSAAQSITAGTTLNSTNACSSGGFISTVNTAGSFVTFTSLASSLGSTSSVSMQIGQGSSTNESAYLTYTRNGVNSTNSLVEISVYGAAHGLQVNGLGKASINGGAFFDYQEGSWSPLWLDVSGSAGSFSVPTPTTNVGTYVKCGKQITVMFYIYQSAGFGSVTGTTALGITAFPYAINNTNGQWISAVCTMTAASIASITDPLYMELWTSGSSPWTGYTFDGVTAVLMGSGNNRQGAPSTGTPKLQGTISYMTA